MARIGAKLYQNAFQTIPDVSFFDANFFLFDKIFGSKIAIFADLAWFWSSHGRTDLKISFLVKFCSR